MLEEITGHQHADISEAIKYLKEKNLVDGPKTIKTKRGRPQLGYTINHDGMELLLSFCTPPRFWEILSNFCYSREENVSETVNRLYASFVRNYTGYNAVNLSDRLLETINSFCERWYNAVERTKDGHIAHKVILALAVEGTLDETELSSRLGVNKDEIVRIVYRYSSSGGRAEMNEVSEFTADSYYSSHSIEMIPTHFGKQRFKLTLIGIILALYSIRKCDENGIYENFIYKDYTVEDYYARIASKYNDKLPMIFGKWPLLKQSLDVMSTFNFDVVLYKKFRSDLVYSSGNSVLYNSVSGVFEDCKKLLADLEVVGFFEMMNTVGKNWLTVDSDYKVASRIIWRKLELVYELWLKLAFVLIEKGLDYESIKQKLSKDEFLEQENIAQIIYQYSVKTIEQSLENEITTLYYLSLNEPYKFHVMPSHYLKSKRQFFGIGDSPVRKLATLMEQDKVILELIQRTLQDAVTYNKKLTKQVENLKMNLGIN